MQENKNLLEQPNKYKWRENPPDVTPAEMRAAMTNGREGDKFECECWNKKCPNFGDCRKCIVFEMCLGQLATCQMNLLEELKEHHAACAGCAE